MAIEATASPSAWPAPSCRRLRSVTGLNPQAIRPPTSPAVRRAASNARTYVNEASVFPARIWLRRSERVRIIFNVPPESSAATMSPATSAVTS